MNKEKEIENGWENLEEKIERIMATVQQIKNKADNEVITQDQNIKDHKVEIINYQSFPQNDKINDNHLNQLELLDNSLNSSINKFDKTIQIFKTIKTELLDFINILSTLNNNNSNSPKLKKKSGRPPKVK